MVPDSNYPVKKILFVVFVIAGVAVAGVLGYKLFVNRDKLLGTTLLSVSSSGGPAEIFIDNNKIGNAPIESKEVRPGDHNLRITNGVRTYEATIPFAANSHVIVVRDLGVGSKFSSGQTFWFDSKDLSSKLSVVSEPSQATVFIDDTEVGKTPYSTSILTEGGYDLKVAKDGYEPQIARIKIQKDYKLNASFQLFLRPMPEKPSLLSGFSNIFNLSSSNVDLTLDVSNWALGASYFGKTRSDGAMKFTYFFDYNGTLYDGEGKAMAADAKAELKSGDIVAYLGRASDPGMTKEASAAAARLAGAGGKKVKVTPTPTGWLNVRSEPVINATNIVGKVNVGDVLAVSEEKAGWAKITYGDGKTGWVSATYLVEVK